MNNNNAGVIFKESRFLFIMKSKNRFYLVGRRYYSSKKNIIGLEIYRPIFKEFGGDYQKYSVYEDFSPDKNFWNRKKVFTGTLTECRKYMKNRFSKQ